MAYDQIYTAGTGNHTIEVPIRSSTTGQLLTGKVFGNMTIKYQREGEAAAVTVSVVTATKGVFTSGGWVETDIAGLYQFGIPDLALAVGANAVTFTFSCSGIIDVTKRILLVAEDLRNVLISSRGTSTYSGTSQTADVATLITTVGAAGAGLTALGDTRLSNLDATVSSRSTYAGTDTAGTTALLGILTGITSLPNWLRGLYRKDAMDGLAKSEINIGGGTFNEATDSIEAIRDTEPMGSAMRGTDGAYTGTPPTASDNAVATLAAMNLTPPAVDVTKLNGDSEPLDNLLLSIESGGYLRANLVQILGATLTETSGQIAAAFKKFFNVGTPTGTVNSFPDAVAGLPNGLAIVGSEMNLADDAITSGKFDESTAFPLELVDSGVSKVSRVGGDSDTLETLSDQLDAIQAVTGQLDLSAVTQVPANFAGYFTITVGLTFSEIVSGLPIQVDWQMAYWTLKAKIRDSDSASIMQLVTTNPSAVDDGLNILLGSTTLPSGITAGSASLTIDQGAGTASIYLEDDLTALLSEAKLIGWDLKFIDSSSDSVGRRGKADIVLTETKAV